MAQYQMGLWSYNGDKIKRDYEEAAKWMHRAAEQKFATAQRHLGFMYLNGYGVKQSNEEGITWIRQAAEQGFAQAQLTLGDMYFTNEVMKDYKQAYMWYSLYVLCGGSKTENMIEIEENTME